jgi:pyridoxal phosphate enzyme (YggS family)
MTVAQRYAELRNEIDEELRACGREPGGVTLVGVAKLQPLERVREAIEAGLRDVGENRLQEAQTAFAQLPNVRKHFIGHVQTNKAKGIATLFDVVQSVDRLEAGLALAKAAAAAGRILPVLIQINLAEPGRYGCAPADAPALAERLRREKGIRVDGMMAMGPYAEDRTVIFAAFERAAKTFARVGGSILSIGMTGDWREAVRAGSTMVRIGTALFGERPPRRQPS